MWLPLIAESIHRLTLWTSFSIRSTITIMSILYLLLGLLLGYAAAYVIHGLLIARKRESKARDKRELLEQERQKLLSDKAVHESNQQRDREQIQSLETRLREKSEALDAANRDLATLGERLQNRETELLKGKEEIQELLEKNKAEFENLARRILDEQSVKFSDKNREKLDEVLRPFQVKIQEFREKVESTHREQSERFVEFRANLQNLKDLNQQISEEANALTKALKGDTKRQGSWGEMLLERILEKSGLTPGEEYTTQESYTAEVDGQKRRVRPDVIVHLPGERHVVIDSKVSLTAFEQYVNAEDDAEAGRALQLHIQSVSAHIKGISAKNYQQAHGLNSLDFILVFIPIEAAFNLALQRDTALYDSAFDRNIVIVTPSTLLATLRVVENLWRQENQNRNALKIAEEAGKLYDKFVAFTEDMQLLSQRLNQAREAFDKAENKLATGKGNLVKRADDIRALGARATKSLPPPYQP